MRTTVTAVCIALVVALVSFVPAEAKDVSVEVTSISASVVKSEQRREGVVELDPRLAPISKSLKSLFAYDNYTFLSKERASVELRKSRVFRLPEHFAIEITPDRSGREPADMIAMHVTLFRDVPMRRGRQPQEPEREVVLRTEIRLKSGGTVLLGGPPIRNGVLVLALSAKG